MKTQSMAMVLVALLVPACGKKSKPLGDKKTACDNIYSSYRSHQDPKVWADACMAAPDETVRCVNLIMDEGKDDACMKAVKSPERTKLVTVLNGSPEAAPAAPAAPAAGSAAPAAGALGDKMSMVFVKQAGGFAVFKLTNNTTDCAVKSLGYKGYTYDKSGTKLKSTGAGKDFDPPMAPGDSSEQNFDVGSGFKDGMVGEVVITSVECANGTKWEDDSKATPDRPMGGVK